MTKQLYLPLAVSISCIFSVYFVGSTASNSFMLALFGVLVVLWNVVILPLFFGFYVSKPNVDMAYYFLGLIGIILFFEAERYEREISELRESHYDAVQTVQSIQQSISSLRENAQRELDAALQRLESLRKENEKHVSLFVELTDDRSELALGLMNLTRKNIVARLETTDSESDALEKSLLSELAEIEKLSDFVTLHNYGPRYANLVRTAMDPNGSIIPFRVRECYIDQADNCEFPKDVYRQDETTIDRLRTTLDEIDNGSLEAHAQLADAEVNQKQAEETLANSLRQRDSGSTISDGFFVYADLLRRSYWPYAIIIAFSLKLASANSARSNEARANAARAQEIHAKAALAAKPDSREGVRALRKAIKLGRKQLRRAETLGEANEAAEILFNLVEAAEQNGQRSLARTGLGYWSKFASSFKPYEETSSGLMEKARLLRKSGDIFVLLADDDVAKSCFTSSYGLIFDTQRRSFGDDGVFELATAVVRLIIVETRLGNSAGAEKWREKLNSLQLEMDSDFNREIENMLARARTTLVELS